VIQYLPEEHVLWTREDHQIQNIIDYLQHLLYYVVIDATTKEGLKRSDIQKIHRQAPKRIPRPGEPKEKPKFLSGKELKKSLFRGGKIQNPRGHKEKGV
jgi:hypothetical protein